MKHIQKIVSLLLVLALSASLLLALVSCGSSEEIDELKNKINTLTDSVKTLTDNVTALGGDVSGLSGDISKVTGDVGTVSGNVSGLSSDLSKVNGSVGAISEGLSSLNKDLTNLSDKVSALEGNVKDVAGAQDKLEEGLGAISSALEPAPEEPVPPLAFDYGEECYEKIKYIDAVLHDRDAFHGENFALTVKWIKWNLMQAGYAEDEIVEQDFTINRYTKTADLATTYSAVKSYTTDGKTYKRSGRTYVEDPEGEYSYVTLTLSNLVVVKKGVSDQQIIIGAHFDGDGTGDNGSGIALNLTTAQKVHDVETPYTLVFIFFNAEEYGCYGSTAYANAMTDEEVAKTLYMINMDSLVCGDYCNLYSGIQDDENKTVLQAGPYYNAIEVAESIGLSFRTNPWTWENPAPGYDAPDYASPSTGDWSDHKGFKYRGIPYLYFEATNWEIPGPYAEYDGYGETYLIGMLMNTKNDYLDYIEKYFPGRILSHISQFSALLNALIMQENVSFAD